MWVIYYADCNVADFYRLSDQDLNYGADPYRKLTDSVWLIPGTLDPDAPEVEA